MKAHLFIVAMCIFLAVDLVGASHTDDDEDEEDTCPAPGHPCDSNPCQNGGTCYEKFGSLTYYRCHCTKNWTGRHCEIVSTVAKPERPKYPGRYIPCKANKFNEKGICFDDLYDF